MNVQESTKLRHAMEIMVLEGIDEEDLEPGQSKEQYVSSRFTGEMMCDYNKARKYQDVVIDWLQGLALHVLFWNDDIVKFYEDVFGRSLAEKESDKEIDLYWSRLSMVVMKMIRSGV